jgi:hypothetical protein
MNTGSTKTDDIGDTIRHWVYYDKSITELNKKIRDLRNLKHTYEAKALELLKARNMTAPVIQVTGGRILVTEDKTSEALTFTMLQSMLDEYYAAKPGSKNETKEILKYIREHRTTETKPCLRLYKTQRTRTTEG